MQQTSDIILGIDPGTNFMGYGLIRINGKQCDMLDMGVLMLHKLQDPYVKLLHIAKCVNQLCQTFHPTELAIEAPFFGKNVQSMLKLGRAQGVAIAAAMQNGVRVTEYEPRKIKMAITGNGAAAKEQVAEMIRRYLNIPVELMTQKLDATDALAAAYCHYIERQKPFKTGKAQSWKDFLKNNPDKVC
ncbi:MAG: crossover junction endodeoxyribonuclease RuvC [Paludibacteraceae bacterium]|nr:crossover junction endodeoxyribonuclease RuvC [Paludibacteraceae bacterium]